uniref:Uncharacterized protein n=1 Tax=Arcella intermedia TaxID=1963864 RepID=A0A6B2LUB1_9EUKA
MRCAINCFIVTNELYIHFFHFLCDLCSILRVFVGNETLSF